MEDILFGGYGLSFTDREFEEAKKAGEPLIVDLAIPCPCRNKCIYCGWADTPVSKGLTKEEIFDFLKNFSEIGGKSVRVLGRGEPLSRTDILEIFDFMNDVKLIPTLFNCGDIIGDDDYCRSLHGMGGVDLLNELKKRDVSIFLKYDKKDEDSITGVPGYSEKRNLALHRIIDAGFNRFSPSHIGTASVILVDNFEELPQIYERGLKNNIYPFLCPIMPVGRAKEKPYRERIGVTGQKLVDLAVKLYTLAFQYGIEYKRPSDFLGTWPCTETKAGFYLDDVGDVFLCESDAKFGNIKGKNLLDLWKGIDKRKRKLYGDKGCDEGKCFPKRLNNVILADYDEQVDKRVKAFISEHPDEFNSKKKAWDFKYKIE